MKPDRLAFEHLDAGGVLIVAAREAARALRHAYDRTQRAAGRAVWESARVLTLDDWLALLWREWRVEHRDSRTLMSDSQVTRAFEAIIDAHSPTPLLNVAATAHAAVRSWRRLLDWRVDAPRICASTAEERGFQEWTQRYETRQREHGWIDRGQLAAMLTAVPPKSITGARIAFHGFEEPTPAFERMMDAWTGAGAVIERMPRQLVEARVYSHGAADPEQELIAAAHWARSRLERDADTRLAIIVPNLAERRAAVHAVFERILDPGSLLPTAAERLPLYSIVGGETLAEFAVVDTALKLLGLGETAMSWTDAGRVLRSPYVPGWLSEAGARARLDRSLRKLGRVECTRAELIRLVRAGACPLLADALERAVHELGDRRTPRRSGAWVERFGATLRAAGWPDGRPRSSAEHQAARRLRELLSELAGLDALLPAMNLRAARRELERLCRDTRFQAESGDPPIRILEALEHPGANYDGLWVTGLAAERWPRAAEPDPFLPLDVQRSLGMPWASAAGELEGARRATDQLLGAAQEVIVSWPRQIDESRTEPSPLIAAALTEYQDSDRTLAYAAQVFGARRIEVVSDPGPAIAGVPDTLRGGARVTELQAKCPFRAFGELRLEAARLESPAPGIAPLLRGQVVHRALEYLWRELGSQERLKSLSPSELEARVRSAVDAAFTESGLVEPRRLVALERHWLVMVMSALLEEEKQRAPFRIVDLEVKERFVVGSSALALKIDRIDELDAAMGGGEIILDYKTGRPSATHWVGAQRDLPQLPLYAVARSRPPAGIAFVRVNLREPGFSGMAATGVVGPGFREPRQFRDGETRKRSFAEQVEDWRAWVTGLIKDHVAGVAFVDPLSAETCRECALAALCRIGSDMPAEDWDASAD